MSESSAVRIAVLVRSFLDGRSLVFAGSKETRDKAPTLVVGQFVAKVRRGFIE